MLSPRVQREEQEIRGSLSHALQTTLRRIFLLTGGTTLHVLKSKRCPSTTLSQNYNNTVPICRVWFLKYNLGSLDKDHQIEKNERQSHKRFLDCYDMFQSQFASICNAHPFSNKESVACFLLSQAYRYCKGTRSCLKDFEFAFWCFDTGTYCYHSPDSH